MYPDKTYTRKISISILKYSTSYTRPTLHCSICSVNLPPPFLYSQGWFISKEGCRALLLLVMYRFCSDMAPHLASFSFTMFIGPAAVARQVLQKGSVCFSRYFLGIGSLIFSKFWHSARNPNEVVHDRTRFFTTTCFTSNTEKVGQSWTQT